MGRRRTTVFEDLLEIAAKLPWWLGLALAGIFYVWLHRVAIEPVPTAPADMKNLGGLMAGMYWRAFASVLQYFLPGICVIGAGVSAYRRFWKRQENAANVSYRQAPDATPAPANHSQAGSAPSCPQCSAPMVRRTARKGTRAGSSFWGCSRYPQCRGTLQG